ncbi:putative endoplasmic reticulum protein [Cantharellus anzutake]|uniref:putative endoplasmic reticulum protein n=1 Tax=Cantharellus anzutake TaxID=1750568 RepID=UPI0019038C29|nr:putative endoplasmic reticulum protein [Cantharellus anzutake]KAF8338298.1 putative endoplasmic reticulum protein [Cantharellus anzutake]
MISRIPASVQVLRTLNAAGVRASASSLRVSQLHSSPPSRFTVVSYAELKPLTQQPTLDRILIDVREVNEVQQGSIPSAVNLPLSVLPQAMEQHPDAFRNQHGFQRPEKGQEVILYCRSGARSTTAAEHLEKIGYKNVKNYTGSWLDWTAKEQGTKNAT